MQLERRLHPRVATDLSGLVRFEGQAYPVSLVNISLSGFLIEGDGELTKLQAPPGCGGLDVQLRFQLDGEPINALCRVVYKRRLSINRTALGLTIISLPDDEVAIVDRFVERHLHY
ncbi:PilZ domain-containing protein [Marinobacterium litorale]|uniref:PilZ domain-containing protein n=1 Tax=Marinobacterium litorale TaxID=404770 RepID=UPI00040E5E28|nr:PilZ domain-containing protein [Marinobacterium litorale]